MTSEDELVLKYENFIYLAIKRLHIHWNTDDEFQDFVDSGYDGIITGIRRYDETKGFQMSTFVYKCIETELKKRMYLNSRPKRATKVVSLNTAVEDGELLELIPDTTDIETEVMNKARDQELLKLVNNLPKEKDRCVMKMLYGLDGYKELSMGKTAKIIGVNRNAITSRRNKNLKILKEKIKKEGL